MAPLIAALIKAGLGTLASAVISEGKDVIQEKLGVDIGSMLGTEEGKLKLKELELKHEEFLITAAQKAADQQLEEQKEDNKNTASARDMNAAIQQSANADHLAKVAAYYLDFIIILSTVGLAYTIFLSETKLVNQELAYTAFGSLLTMCGTILNFHRGTSKSSSNKDSTIDVLSKQVVK